MDELKRLARYPLKAMDELLAEAAAVAAAADLSWEAKAARLRAKQEACLREVEAHHAGFREAAAAAETGLRRTVGEPRPSVLDSARRYADQLRGLLEEARAREALLQAWEGRTPAEFLLAYREATAGAGREVWARLDACGEQIVRRLGGQAHLEAFRELRRQWMGREGTPEERAALRFLEMLRDLQREAEALYGMPGLRRGMGSSPPEARPG